MKVPYAQLPHLALHVGRDKLEHPFWEFLLCHRLRSEVHAREELEEGRNEGHVVELGVTAHLRVNMWSSSTTPKSAYQGLQDLAQLACAFGSSFGPCTEDSQLGDYPEQHPLPRDPFLVFFVGIFRGRYWGEPSQKRR
jgi:hypothetical protein